MLTENQTKAIQDLTKHSFPDDVATHYNKADEFKIHADVINAYQIIACAEAIKKHNLKGQIKRSGAGLTLIFSSIN